MYRDDNEALFARAEALQREVDELRAQLQEQRAAYRPAAASLTASPPPLPRPRRLVIPQPGEISAQLDRIESAHEPPAAPSPHAGAHLIDEVFLVLKTLPLELLEQVHAEIMKLAR
jgi:hypothetical protein